MVHALELQRDDIVELLLGDVMDRLEQPPTRSIDRDINFAVALKRGLGERLDLGLGGDIASDPIPRQAPRQRRQFLGITPGYDDFRACIGHRAGDVLAHVAGASGSEHDCDFA